ncbi:hypothetical protein OPAG_06692 [Rhodococcus opacus PD630]|uniref:hypothetical protein n=1 Tax=Rhodococcus opacus TaxID=37919 RepID=UPI00029CC414|nr:hypothetical protein [Rhodococcus opacus]EHI43415.1 hypothetical protein OPAG_06692 [Rhodococcus opacus PD630]UDH01408.1 hypothetical protein K2Z90_007925 [Rhodococcus opacus PD630]
MPGSHLAEASFRVTDSGVPGNQWVGHPTRLERLLLQRRNLRPGTFGRDVHIVVAQCSLSAGSAASAVAYFRCATPMMCGYSGMLTLGIATA